MSGGFRIPAGPGESELTEKRSRFLGHLVPVESEEEAKEFVSRMKKQYHDRNASLTTGSRRAVPECRCWKSFGGKRSLTSAVW